MRINDVCVCGPCLGEEKGSTQLGMILMFIALRHPTMFPMALTMGNDYEVLRALDRRRYEFLLDRFGLVFMGTLLEYFSSTGDYLEAHIVAYTMGLMDIDLKLGVD